MTDDPAPLGQALRDVAGRGPIGTWLGKIYDEQHRRNQARRERVLRYDDLREALMQRPLSYSKPEMWNGYVPPRYDADDPGEYVHSSRINSGHRRTVGSRENASPERAVLVAISRLAYEREVEAGRTPEPEPDLIEMFPFPFPGLQRGERYDWPAQPAMMTLAGEPAGQVEPADEPPNPDYQHEPRTRRGDE